MPSRRLPVAQQPRSGHSNDAKPLPFEAGRFAASTERAAADQEGSATECSSTGSSQKRPCKSAASYGSFFDNRAEFTEKQIDLVSTLADQAAIAIENVRLFDEIQDKSRQLAEASERKSQFLASMSHELRTPLNAIIGLTEMMVTNAARFGTEKALEPLRRANAAGTHLLSLINEILDLSKIEAGKLELNPEPVNLARLIDEVVGTAGHPRRTRTALSLKRKRTWGGSPLTL